jgi:membrane associated rhomboid family serine protease
MQSFARHWPSGRPSVTVVLVAVSLVAAVVQSSFWLFDRGEFLSQEKLFAWLGLSAQTVSSGHVWQFLSFAFLYAHPLPLLANMLVLYFAGREVEPIVGLRHFVGLYAMGNLVGGVSQWGAYVAGLAPAGATMVGVSAGVAAVLAAYATILPELEVVLLLFFVLPVRIRAKWIGLGTIASAGLLWVFAGDSPVGPAGIVAGCVVGWAYAKELGFGNPLAIERYLCDKRQHAARIERMPAEQFIREEIDPILEKIARCGKSSLSRSERKLLEKGRAKLAASESREK